ncbi:MAG: hypothetical protein HYX89_01470 [Chloroflexi bacterium]|nr:hypothetical protein [Chloroflexota bacterium]
MIQQGLVLLDGQTVKASQRVNPGQLVTLDVPPPQPFSVEPKDLPLRSSTKTET